MRPLLCSSLVRGCVALSFLIGTMRIPAQEIPTISVNVKVVNVLATVRDKKGKIINTLSKDDFMLEEDGRPQTIKYFTRETDIPLTLGLLVDTSLSQIQVIDEEKTASAAFTNDVMRVDEDSAFVIHFDEEVELLQDLTKSPLQIQSALDQLQIARSGGSRGGGGGGYPGGGSARRSRHGAVGTALYDSIFLASDELMQKQSGRKAIILLTDGMDMGSKVSLERAIESAQRADTMVCSIYFAGIGSGGWGGGPWGGRRGGNWPGGGGGWPGRGYDSDRGKKVLERLSRETGGRMFEVGKKMNITEIYAQIQDELRNQYNLGYTPDRKDARIDYRHIKVTARQRDLTVQAREGYYASKQLQSRQVQGQ